MHSHHFIAEQAKTWINTPFTHQGRLKGVGCDCLGLIIGIAQELNLKAKSGLPLTLYDRTDYHFIKHNHLLKQKLDEHFTCCAEHSGCIALISNEKRHYHLGIIYHDVKDKYLIHANLSAGKVVQNKLIDLIKDNISSYYNYNL